MDAREEIKRWLALLAQMASEAESEQIKADIGLLMGVTGQLVTELANRNAALAKRCRPRKATPPKASPVSGPKKGKGADSSTDTPNAQDDAEDRPQTISRIQQGIQQADPSLKAQQQALRGQIYGAQNANVAFRKGAKTISL